MIIYVTNVFKSIIQCDIRRQVKKWKYPTLQQQNSTLQVLEERDREREKEKTKFYTRGTHAPYLFKRNSNEIFTIMTYYFTAKFK